MSSKEAGEGKVYLVTGSNVGLGFEATRQLALKPGNATKKVYMACRSETKALAAIKTLHEEHGIPKDKLAFVPFDSADNKDDIASKALAALPKGETIDGLIFNAGGPGQDRSGKPTGPNGVVNIYQINILGHVHLLEALMSNGYLGSKDGQQTTIICSGSEAARGIPEMGSPAPTLPTTVDGYKNLMNGSAGTDTKQLYAFAKAITALYWAAWAKKHPNFFVLTVSPGATRGTAIGKDFPFPMNWIVSPMFWIMQQMGRAHPLEVGAKRYVDAMDRTGEYQSFPSGTFVASAKLTSGPVMDQSKLPDNPNSGAVFADEQHQSAAFEAVSSFL